MASAEPALALAEMARLLGPGGRLVLLLPAGGPLTVRDRVRYVRLLAALRITRLPSPHQQVLADPAGLVRSSGLTVTEDERRRFGFDLVNRGSVRAFVNSLYLPGPQGDRRRAAERVVGRWVGSDLGIPLRRLVARRA